VRYGGSYRGYRGQQVSFEKLCRDDVSRAMSMLVELWGLTATSYRMRFTFPPPPPSQCSAWWRCRTKNCHDAKQPRPECRLLQGDLLRFPCMVLQVSMPHSPLALAFLMLRLKSPASAQGLTTTPPPPPPSPSTAGRTGLQRR
jgi:hypothetical protein